MLTISAPEGVVIFAVSSCACPPDRLGPAHVCTNACTSWVYIVTANPLRSSGWRRVRAGSAARAAVFSKNNPFPALINKITEEFEQSDDHNPVRN